MFKVDVKFDPSRPVHDVIQIEPEDFKLPPHGHSKDEDFDPTVHLELEPEKKEGEDETIENFEEADDNVSYDSDGNPHPKKPKIFKLVAPALFRTWLFIAPDKKMILTKLQETLTDGLESL